MSKLPIHNMNDTKCVHCQKPIIKRVSVANPRDGLLQKGTIMVCSYCLQPMILGDTSWRPLTREDFKRLPIQSQRQLLVVAKGLEGLLLSGKEWTPYDQKPIG